ncbi:hypothetical protein PAHAL_5G244300 [Panicum hallii]|uniref:Uncharacterized protein n=1 Tax=Panicum hallii TaxID=206008 RepID=A0A2T8IL13_9POAL|nr:hypothetical protein PAHAL_5G244300 [Panicum hallii]
MLSRAPSVGVDRWAAGSRVMSARAVAAGNNNWRASGTGMSQRVAPAPAWSLTCSRSRGSSSSLQAHLRAVQPTGGP